MRPALRPLHAQAAPLGAVNGYAPGWDDELDALEVDLVVLPASARLAYVLHAWREWEALHQDARWVVLRRPR